MQQARIVGRYILHQSIASGGMATVHLGLERGPLGASRTVAIKRLHPHLASDLEFVSMFIDEARVAKRIRHPNVVSTFDLVETDGELFLVMEYIQGESLARLFRALRAQEQLIPVGVVSAIIAGVLHGLHAAHDTADECGNAMNIVHRDVSPQNVLVGTDGLARILDFGVAKAMGRIQTTREGQLKGKLAYMAPEQLKGQPVSRQSDVYGVGVMLWELVTGSRLFHGESEGAMVAKIIEGNVRPPSEVVRESRSPVHASELHAIEALDATILRALRMNPAERFATALDFALELEGRCPPVTALECGDWVERVAHDVLASRAALIAQLEDDSSSGPTVTDRHYDSVSAASGKPSSATTIVARPQSETPPASGREGEESRASSMDGPSDIQPSSISLASSYTSNERRGTRRRSLLVLGAVAFAAGLFVTLLLFVFQDSRGRLAPEVPTATSSASPVMSLAVAAPEPVPSDSPAPAASKPEVVAVDAGGPGRPSTIGAKAAVRGRPAQEAGKPSSNVRSVRPDASSPSDCAPAFFYDASGVKRYKAHCFGH